MNINPRFYPLFVFVTFLSFGFLPRVTAQVQLGQDVATLRSTSNNNTTNLVELSGDGGTTVVYRGEFEVLIQTWNGTSWIQKGSTINLSPVDYHYSLNVKMSHDGSRIAIGLPHGPNNSSVTGYVLVFEWSGTDWSQMGSPILPDSFYGQNAFVRSISISDDGETLAISDPYYKNGTTSESMVLIYKWSGINWDVQSQISRSEGGLFGTNIDLNADGSKIVISAPSEDSFVLGLQQGMVFNYAYNGISWVARGNGVPGIVLESEEGHDVALSGDGNTFITDSRQDYGNPDLIDPNNYEDEGAVRIFEFDGLDWVQKGGDLKRQSVRHSQWREVRTVDLNFDGSKIIVGSNLYVPSYDLNNERQYNRGIDYFVWTGNQWTSVGFVGVIPNVAEEIGVQAAMGTSGDTVVTQYTTFSSRNQKQEIYNRVYRWCFDPAEDVDTTACDTITLPNGILYNQSQNGITYFITRNSCFVQQNVNLTILNSTDSLDVIKSCSPIIWHDGNTYSSSNNTAEYKLPNSVGCDSVVKLDFTLQTDTVADTQVKCTKYTWIDGISYSESNTTATHTLTNIYGCDSVINLDLTINRTSGVDQITACENHTWINGITYTQSNNTARDTILNTAGCDSVVQLDLTINPVSATADKIVACESYTWIDGITYNTSTNTPTHTLQNIYGCDSVVTLNLLINPAHNVVDNQMACNTYTWINGITYTTDNNTATHTLKNQFNCDSIVRLNLNILNNSGTDVISACEKHTWLDGLTYVSSNNSATHTLTNSAGCDSLITLDLTIKTNSSATDVQAHCGSYTWIDGLTYTSSNNTATHTIPNFVGCDSLVTLDLTILNNSSSTDVQVLCDSYTWMDGINYTTSNNTATHTIPNALGCDSVIQLDLTLYKDVSSQDVQSACNSYTWQDGNTYTSSNNTASVVLSNVAGCDSTVYLDLTIYKDNTSTDVQQACDSYAWLDGNTYTASNNSATFTTQNQFGCDSVITLNLTVLQSTQSTDKQTECDTYTWMNGITYTTSNSTSTHTIPNFVGCDSTITLDLTILKSTTSVDVLTACESYTWIDGITYTADNSSATYTIANTAGCDSTVTLNLDILKNSGTDTQFACKSLTWIDGNTYNSNNSTATHTLINQYGCDSLVTLNLTIGNNTGADVIPACDTYTWIDGNTYTVSNNSATHTLTNSKGCDSLVTLNLSMAYSNSGTAIISACDTYTWIDGNTYITNNSTATHMLTNQAGCDSTVTLNLSVNYSSSYIDVHQTCAPFIWLDGTSYSQNNSTATHTITNNAGCDSVIQLDLTILNSFSVDQILSCDPISWIDGNTYSSNNNSATHTLSNQFGCDSVVTLDYTILSNSGTDNITACDSITWIDGITYTTSNSLAQHTLTNQNGCDSVVSLQLDLSYSGMFPEIIQACDSFLWVDGNTYTSANNTAEWILTGPNGCDSVLQLDLTLLSSSQFIDSIQSCGPYTWIDGNTYNSDNFNATHTINNSVGCDSIIQLYLVVNSPSNSMDNIVACNSYEWLDGNTYSSSNSTATHKLSNSAGCDSIITLNLTIYSDDFENLSLASCESYHWTFTDSIYTQSGTYSHTIPTTNGCDSTKILDLTINPRSSSADQVTACESYNWDVTGFTYTQSGNYTWNGTSVYGCDSVVELQLIINQNDSTFEQQESCLEYVWLVNGTTYSTSGTYEMLTPNSSSCFDVHQLELTIHAGSTETIARASCASFYWDLSDSTYTTSTQDQVKYTNTQGCDSIVALDLTLFQDETTNLNIEACDSMYWEGNATWLRNSGTYSYVDQNRNGCDSLVTMDLIVHPSSSQYLDTISCGENFYWEFDQSNIQISGFYSSTLLSSGGCDSTETLNLMVNPIGPIEIKVDGTFLEVNPVYWDRIEWEFCDLKGTCKSLQSDVKRIEGLDNGIYRAKIMFENCTTTIELPLENYGCQSPFYVPNTFTPDFDNINDTYSLVNKGCPVTEFTFTIYDRWGTILFKERKEDFKWDGTSHGYDVAPGVYNYILEYTTESFTVYHGRQTGRLHILR